MSPLDWVALLGPPALVGAGLAVAALALGAGSRWPARRPAAEPALPPPNPRVRPVSGVRERVASYLDDYVAAADRRRSARGRTTKAERLVNANLKMRPSELVVIQVAIAGALFLLALIRFGVGLQLPVAAVAGYLAPELYVSLRHRRRAQALAQQIPDTLGLVANSLRAGHALSQALARAAESTTGPISEELGRVVRAVTLGADVETALESAAARIRSRDFDLVVVAVSVHRSTGGDLAAVLDTIASTIADRVKLHDELMALTAQARTSVWIITLLPIGLAVLLYVIAPTYFRPMLSSPIGWVLLVIAALLMLAGNLLARRGLRLRYR